MKNKTIEHEGKSYIVESINKEKLKVKEFVFDLSTNKFVKLGSKTISGDFKEIPLEIIKIKYSKDIAEEENKTKKEE